MHEGGCRARLQRNLNDNMEEKLHDINQQLRGEGSLELMMVVRIQATTAAKQEVMVQFGKAMESMDTS